jgi:hypothetical protein
MDVVMFHSGEELPVFLEDNFKQLRLFNPDIPVHFITDEEWLDNEIFKIYNINAVNKFDYYSRKIDSYQVYFKYSDKAKHYQFWVITALRLIYIENFMKQNKMINVCHFENDVLLYFNIKELHGKFIKLYPNLAITVGGPDKCITGFMFIKSYKDLELMTQFFVEMLQLGKNEVIKRYGMDMVNEMTLIRAYSKDYPEAIKFLPILPFGEFSNNYNEFNSIFDPASWGQFVGGNIQEKKPGLKPEDHYIGQLLREHLGYDVVWHWDDEKRLIPYFRFNKQEVKINNLHIHSKNLSKYMS